MMLTKVEDGLGMTCVRGKLVWADPLPPFPPILTIPTIIYHTYPPCPTHHYLPTLHSILTLSTILMCRNHYQTRYTSTRLFTIFNRQNSAITHSRQLVWCVFLQRHFFSTFHIAHTISNETCPFSLRSRYVECNMHRAVYSNTRPYNITPKGFPLCGVSSYA